MGKEKRERDWKEENEGEKMRERRMGDRERG